MRGQKKDSANPPPFPKSPPAPHPAPPRPAVWTNRNQLCTPPKGEAQEALSTCCIGWEPCRVPSMHMDRVHGPCVQHYLNASPRGAPLAGNGGEAAGRRAKKEEV